MTASDDADARARLAALIASGHLPRSAADAGKALLERLDAPVRVTLFGLPGSGRARVVNMLAGQRILPEDRPLPTLSLRHGGIARTVATLPDGGQTTWPDLPLAQVDASGAAYLDITWTAPALRDFSLLEIAADDTDDDQVAAMHWAEARTDIALWISRAFAPREAEFWRRAPDRLKDHACLVLTGTETAPQSAPGFGSVLVVPPGAQDAPALKTALSRRAAQGREAYLDHVLMFLSRYESRRTSQFRMSTPVVDLSAERVKTAQLRNPTRPVPAPAAPAVPAGNAVPKSEPLADPTLIPAEAVAFLRSRADELERILDWLADAPEQRVLGFCLETIEALAEKVASAEMPDPTTADVEEMVLEAADVIMLLQAEQGIAPATDAITLLLQLRRDLEARLAA